MRPIPALVLAAGMSRRLGRPKQLLDLGGSPIIRHVTERALASRCDGVVVVVGYEADTVGAAIADLPVRIVANPTYAEGMSTSLHAGIAALPDGADGAVVLLGDQPEVEPDVIAALIAARRETGAPVVRTHYRDRPSNPVLFGCEAFPDLMRISGDRGGREVVRAYRDRMVTVPVDAAAPEDVDTEEAYRAIQARWPKPTTARVGGR